MARFLGNEPDPGTAVAMAFGLTPRVHRDQADSPMSFDHPANAGLRDVADSVLGWMCLKVLRDPAPTTRAGRPYTRAEVDFFWDRVAAEVDRFPAEYRAAVVGRLPSPELSRAARDLAARFPVFTLTGRLRADAGYTQRHNNVFQGPAADGAKLALWRLWRAGYRLANFVHDEGLLEVPDGPDLEEHARRIERLEVEGMAEVVPDVPVRVGCRISRSWAEEEEVATAEIIPGVLAS